VYVAVQAISTKEKHLHVDDFKGPEIYSAPEPPDLSSPANAAINVALNASLTWNGVLGADSYKVYLGTNENATNILDGEDVGTDLSYTLSGLDYETVYYWTVVATNIYGDSDPATIRSFTTRLDPTRPIPFLEDFNASTAWPSEWINNEMLISATHGNASNGVYKNLYGSETTGSFITCPIGPLAAVSEIKFDYRYMAYTFSYPGGSYEIVEGDKIEVQISTDDGQTFETIHVIDHTNHVVSADFATPTVPVIGYTGQVVKVRFVATWGAGDYYVDFDNIIVRETPTGVPDPVVLVSPADEAENILITPTLAWATVLTGGTPTAYDLYFGTTNPPAETVLVGEQAGTSYTFTTDLEYSTTYYWQVIPKNSFGSAINCPVWAFTTMADPTITTFPYTEGFEAGNTQNSTEILNWTQISVTGTEQWTANSTLTDNNRTPRSGNFNAFLLNGNNDWLFRPIQLTGGTTYRFEIYARQDGTSGAQLTVKYGNEATVAGI
jgi:hypothetical protein